MLSVRLSDEKTDVIGKFFSSSIETFLSRFQCQDFSKTFSQQFIEFRCYAHAH